MSKIENNKIYYDPYNEIRCDKFALENFVKESEEKDKTIAELEAKLAIYEKDDFEDLYYKSIGQRKELEQQLAEKDESHHKNIVELTKMATEKDRNIEQLKQQLAIQENTITNLVEDNRASQEWYKKQLAEKDEAHMKAMENALNDFLTLRQELHQDKISFALEQLEKVKEYWLKHEDVSYYIDNQIKQLKEMK